MYYISWNSVAIDNYLLMCHIQLTLHHCCCQDQVLSKILRKCQAIILLDVSYTRISNASICSLARHSSTLRWLSLAYCCSFTEKGLYYLEACHGCCRLSHLDLSGCVQISFNGYSSMASCCSELRTLILNDLPTLTDSCLSVLSENNHNLQKLSVVDCPTLTDIAFEAVAMCINLNMLKIEGNSNLTETTLRALSQNCGRLKHMRIKNCAQVNNTSLGFLSSLHNLTVLNLSQCPRVGESGIKSLAEGNCGPKLRELNLSSCSLVGDRSLQKLAQRCCCLLYLNLSYCNSITNEGLEYLSGLPSLISLDLTAANVQDQGLISLGFIDMLQQLSLSENTAITDKGIQLTDISSQFLARTSQFLHYLNISGCLQLSNRSVKIFQNCGNHLRVLIMLYCTGISRKAALAISPQLVECIYSNDFPPPWFHTDDTVDQLGDTDPSLLASQSRTNCTSLQSEGRDVHGKHC
uniref:F-box/LRR-repeat protein 15-like leucin rich repeat domain-containing protein n=1 Tax=Eptatretus burgeri TaxID=7764 RepID=A0A8C4QDZ9_EPTBU